MLRDLKPNFVNVESHELVVRRMIRPPDFVVQGPIALFAKGPEPISMVHAVRTQIPIHATVSESTRCGIAATQSRFNRDSSPSHSLCGDEPFLNVYQFLGRGGKHTTCKLKINKLAGGK